MKPAIAIAFLAGYFVSDITNDIGFSFIFDVTADVAGMDYYDLKSDYDFKRAVMTILEENCAASIRRCDLKTWHWCGSN